MLSADLRRRLVLSILIVGCGKPAVSGTESASESGESGESGESESSSSTGSDDILPPGAPGFVIDGDKPGDQASGIPCADINGDGLGDILVNRVGTPDYVVFGRSDGTHLKLDEIEPGVDGVAISGLSYTDEDFGRTHQPSITAAGDLNGDGFAELLAHHRVSDKLAEVYVLFGGPALASADLETLSPSEGRLLLALPTSNATALRAVGLGDINGDGLDDLTLVASYGYEGTPDRIYVIYGREDIDQTSVDALEAGDGGFVIDGVYNATEIASGDINGDGIDDLALLDQGGPHHFHVEIYVVFGGQELSALDLDDPWDGGNIPTPPDFDGFTVQLSEPSLVFETARLATDHDLDGDGLADLVLASPLTTDAGNTVAYVIHGRADMGTLLVPEDLAAEGVYAITADMLPVAPTVVPNLSADRNGDLLGELTLSVSSWEGDGESPPGADIYVLYGKADSDDVDLSTLSQGEGGYLLSDWPEGQYLGGSAHWAEIDGIAGLDLVIADSSASPNGATSGRTYVYYDPGLH